MTLQPNYKYATLTIEKSGMWRICWYNTHPLSGKLQRVRKTFDLNRIEDLKIRKETAKQVIKYVNQALEHGYNDFLTPEENASLPFVASILNSEKRDPVQQKTTVLAALERTQQIRCIGRAERTVQTYRSYMKVFSSWLESQNLLYLPVDEFTSEHFQEFILFKAAKGDRGSNINDYTSYFKTSFEHIKRKLKLLPSNPLEEIDLLPEQDSTTFAPLTQEELEIIVPALIEYNPRFYLYTRFIPYEFIRPYHIARLRAGDIAYSLNHIHVTEKTSKSKKNRYKQLLQPIKDMLQSMEYDKVPKHYYLFSNLQFEPGEKLYPSLSIRAAEIWKRIVIDGLGINKKMYALKHTSSQYYMNSNDNADMKFLQLHMEHHSITQTEVYLQDKVYKRIDEGKTKFIDF